MFRSSMFRLPIAAALLALAATRAGYAQDEGGTRADAERMLQGYLAIWSDDALVTMETVDRFYAPQVSYYGHDFTRAQVLADKRAFIRAYPGRSYREVPGSFEGSCNDGRSRCHVAATIEWRRVDRHGGIIGGRARMGFDFVPVEGGRKIAAESARLL